MNTSRTFATLLLCGLSMFAAATAGAATLTCESKDGGYQSCPVDASHGVTLTRQLSTQGCWKNDTWGYDATRIWVNRGCRAEFETGEASSSSSSTGSAVAAAAVVGLAAAAIIASSKNDDHKNKHKNNNNDYDDGYYDRYDNGYYDRYDDRHYQNSRYGYNGYGGDPRWTFTCESRNDKRNYCSIPGRGHVEVYKQRSSSPCTYGRSWGVDGRSLWVANGCRAEFAVF